MTVDREKRDELSALRYLINQYGLTVVDDDGPFILMDGTESPISLRITDPAMLALRLAHALKWPSQSRWSDG
jgi:hypothetical protein